MNFQKRTARSRSAAAESSARTTSTVTSPANPVARFALVGEAISFAARAHRHQVRKDGLTPYVAHPFRACMVVRQVFGIDDPVVLAAAVLHDTIEDTTTDYDDLLGRFGAEVADCVAAMSKDTRRPEAEREAAYLRQLLAGDWRVAVCKLADGYDNLSDFAALSPAGRAKQLSNVAEYLDALRPRVPPQARGAFEIVDAAVSSLRASTQENSQ
jgi:(p)ppGpp synthase/HD superfamily hydrolase